MIRKKAMEGKSAYAISKETGVAENTAKRYISRPVTQHGLKGRVKGSKLDPYKPQVDTMLHQGIFNCVVLLERLQKAGYSGGITILKEYVHPHRPPKSSPAVMRYETLPGKQAQMDWGICHYIDEDDGVHKVSAFVMILSNSRVKYVLFSCRESKCGEFFHQSCVNTWLKGKIKFIQCLPMRQTGQFQTGFLAAAFSCLLLCFQKAAQESGIGHFIVGSPLQLSIQQFRNNSESEIFEKFPAAYLAVVCFKVTVQNTDPDFFLAILPWHTVFGAVKADEAFPAYFPCLPFVFLADGNVIFLGPPGVGKTHLAVGLAMKAIQSSMTVYYTELSKLIADFWMLVLSLSFRRRSAR